MVTAVVAALVLSLVVIVTAFGLATWKVDQTREAWNREMGTWDEVLQHYPHREANGGALELERLSAAVGIDLVTRSAEDRKPADPSRLESYKKIRQLAGRYVEEQIERTRRGVDPPPPELAAHLEAHAEELEALRRRLTDGPPPRWELQIERLFSAPIPNLIGNINLQKLLLADALAHGAGGDHEGALECLEASWKLNAALREDPVLITQLIAIAVTRMQVGTLRQLREVPEVWRERLAEDSFRDSFLVALQLESRIWIQADDLSMMNLAPNLLQKVSASVTKPYAQFCLASFSDQMRERLESLAAAQALCDGDPGYHGADLNVEVPRWNVIGGIIAPTLGNALERLARLELDVELTARLLELEAARSEGGGWPDPAPEFEASRCCPEERWDYRVGPDGAMSIAFSREIDWPNATGPVLPLEFSIGN